MDNSSNSVTGSRTLSMIKSLALKRFVVYTFASCFVIAAVIAFLFVRNTMNHLGLSFASAQDNTMLSHNLAIHAYFNGELKPKLFETFEKNMPEGYFEPSWMSSTFAVREIDRIFKELVKTNYYYKECAINARYPENEADEYERRFIERLNKEPNLDEMSVIRTIGGVKYFTTLHRGEVMADVCLRCHSTPDQAPKGLVKTYGDSRSFGRHTGDVVSAISTRVPLSIAYNETKTYSIELVAILFIVFVVLFLITHLLLIHAVFKPLDEVKRSATEIAIDPTKIGTSIQPKFTRELNELADAFNAMSLSLKQSTDTLETKVEERTRELQDTNGKLNEEIDHRKQVEIEMAKTIEDLKIAMGKIKTLEGILPICMHCKKIRDENDVWRPLDSYLVRHSNVDMSHGLCPDCAKEHYPDVFI